MLEPTRSALRRVAVHIVARARQQATGRFGLRITPGGFGTPEFGDDLRRVRVARGLLVVEAEGTHRSTVIHGATLAGLAEFAGVDLDAHLDVGHDTVPMGDPDAPIAIDADAVDAITDWFLLTSNALDITLSLLGPRARTATRPQLWPEHFDLACDVAFDLAAPGDRRVNLGGSPGDGFDPEPYLYVGPWTTDRPGPAAWWNAPFGATRSGATTLAATDPVSAAVGFLLDGFGRLAGDRAAN